MYGHSRSPVGSEPSPVDSEEKDGTMSSAEREMEPVELDCSESVLEDGGGRAKLTPVARPWRKLGSAKLGRTSLAQLGPESRRTSTKWRHIRLAEVWAVTDPWGMDHCAIIALQVAPTKETIKAAARLRVARGQARSRCRSDHVTVDGHHQLVRWEISHNALRVAVHSEKT